MRESNERGMTLVEVFLALLILAVGITACLRVFQSSELIRQTSREFLQATGLLNNLLFDLEAGEKSDWLMGGKREALAPGAPFVTQGELGVSSRLLEPPLPKEVEKVLKKAGLPSYYAVDLSVDWRSGKKSATLATIVRSES